MYHDIGIRFTTIDDVKLKFRSLQNHWDTHAAPAIVKYAVENGRYQPESDDMNGSYVVKVFTPMLSLFLHFSAV